MPKIARLIRTVASINPSHSFTNKARLPAAVRERSPRYSFRGGTQTAHGRAAEIEPIHQYAPQILPGHAL